MSNNKNQKGTDRDVKPTRGQESNENWDDTGKEEGTDTNAGKRGTNPRTIDEETNTSGVASSQKSKQDNVGPLDADFNALPSEKRRERNSGSSGITE
jgi:hypothetical protein